jgi:c(7)-type cytochrome triheme protein
MRYTFTLLSIGQREALQAGKRALQKSPVIAIMTPATKRYFFPCSAESQKKKGGEEMKKTALFIALLVIVAFVGSALAVPPGKTVEYAGGGAGKVVFDGKAHADKGLKCNDCHTKIFPMKKGGTYTMADMNAGKNCGECHNGTKAFKSSEAADCGKCHKK